MNKNKKTFDKLIDITLLSRKKGYCKVKLNFKKVYLNHGGIVHGGVIATLLDMTLAKAVSTLMNKNEWCVTAQLNIHFISPAFPGKPIYAHAEVKRKGKTLAFVEGGIETSSKTQIARAQGIWVIKSKG